MAITIEDFIDHPVTKLVARGAMTLALMVATGVGGYMVTLGNRIGAVESTLTTRIADQERFQAKVDGSFRDADLDLTSLRGSMIVVQTGVQDMRTDVAMMKGWIQAYMRQNLTSFGDLPLSLPLIAAELEP